MLAGELRIQIDRPFIGYGLADVTVFGALTVDGWALARNGVAGIEVLVNGEIVGSADYALPRADVAEAFPDWPDAANSGFSALIPFRKLPGGRQIVQVIVRDKAGQTTGKEFSIVVGPPALRRKIFQAEIDLQQRVLSRLAWHPTFCLIVMVDPGATAVERSRVTLRSLREQAYSAWHALVVLHHRGYDADALRLHLLDGSSNIKALRVALSGQHHHSAGLFDGLLVGFDDIREKIGLVQTGGEKTIAQLVARQPRPVLFGFLGAGDELSCDALLETAVASATHRDADLYYSDELRVSPASRKCEAFLKPQWSPDLLLSTNYIGRFWCATQQLLERTGATLGDLLRLGDYDLVLRATEAAKRIHHIPNLLCQRDSKVLGTGIAGRRALERAGARRGIAGEIQAGCVAGTYRFKREIAKGGLVSIMIPTRASRGLVKTCIDTLRDRTTYRDFEIVAIENIRQSETHWKEWLRANADKVIETEERFNWSRFMNRAAIAASGEFLLFLNDDIEIIQADWLDALLEHVQRPEVAAVGPLLLYPDRTIQHAGIVLTPDTGLARHAFRHAPEDDPGFFGLALTQRNVIAVTGACFLTRRDVFDRLGRFNEAHRIINNDVDYCLKGWRAGLLTVFTPHSKLIHHERGSRNEFGEDYDHAAFAREWHGVYADGDPYHHPQLSKELDDFVPESEATHVICAGRPVMKRQSIRNILVVKLDHVEDCIMAFPAVRQLKQSFPDAQLRVLATPFTAAVWRLAEGIDEVIEFEFLRGCAVEGIKEISEAELLFLLRCLEPYRFDLAVDLRRQPETRHVLRYTAARFVAGFELQGRFPWLDIALEWGGDTARRAKRNSVADDLTALADAISASCEVDHPLTTTSSGGSLPLPAPLKHQLFSRPVVCVHSGAGDLMKQWPPQYFAELIDLLVERRHVNVALIGSGEDREASEQILRSVSHTEAVYDLIGAVGLADLPNLLLHCTLFIGNDTGPKHLAARLGIPTVGVHSGHVDAREWGPIGPHAVALRREVICGPCYLTDPAACPRDLTCLTGLRPGEVYAACQRLLALGAGDCREVQRTAAE